MVLTSIFSTLIESFLIFLAIFTPVAFGTVDLWAITIMELVICLAFFLWLSKSIIEGKVAFVKTALNMPIALFVSLSLSQYMIGKVTTSKLGTIYPYATRVYFYETLSYCLAFLAIVNNIHTRRQINRFLFSMISVGGALALYGIVQKLAGAAKIFWFREAREVLLFYSSYFNCNYFAGYMNMMIFLSLGAFFAYLAYLDKKRDFYRFDIFEGWNSLFIFSITAMIVSLFHTFSQGGIVVFFMTSIFFYYILLRRALAKKWVIIAISASTIVLTFATLIWIRGGALLDYFYEILRIFKEAGTYGARLPIWSRALNLVKINPISGTGLGTFQYIFPKYRSRLPVYYLPHCHNDYLELLVEMGIIGSLVFLFGMSLFFKRYVTLLRSRHDTYVKLIGYGCLTATFSIFLYSFIDSNMHIGANALLFSYILAIGFVAIHTRSNREGEDSFYKTATFTINTKPRKIYLLSIVLFAFLYIVSDVVSICVADMHASIAKLEKDVKAMRIALRMEPSSSEYHYLLADLMLREYQINQKRREVINAIIDELKESIRLNPNVARYHQRLGWVYSRYIKDKEKAVEELKAAQALEPINAFNYLILAMHYFNEATKLEGINPYGSKAMEEGVAEYRKALSIDPAMNIDRYKYLLKDYPKIKDVLERYYL